MTECNEIFEELISIEAYGKDEVTFTQPVELSKRFIYESEFSFAPGSGFKILFNEDNAPTLKEKVTSLRGGNYRTVSVAWSNDNVDISVINQYEKLQNNYHHFIFTRLDGRKYLLRTDDLCYKFSYAFDGTSFEAALSYSSEVGLQFMQ